VVAQHLREHRILDRRDAECLRHAEHGDVVVRGPDPARGEEPVVGGRQSPHFARDLFHVVEDDHHTPELDPETPQRTCEDVDIRLLDLPGQELVADHKRCRCRRRLTEHAASLADLQPYCAI
jgi:hypothetical protein